MNWRTELEPRLRALADEKLANFSSGLNPGCKPMLGVRLPELRKIAKELAKENYRDFLEQCPDTYFEYETLQAYVLGYAKDDIETILSYADRFVPKIKDWSVNDSFCQNFTVARKYRERVYDWLMGYAKKEEEFSQRVVAVLLMSHFLVPEYIDRVLAVMDTLQYDGYYTKMGWRGVWLPLMRSFRRKRRRIWQRISYGTGPIIRPYRRCVSLTGSVTRIKPTGRHGNESSFSTGIDKRKEIGENRIQQ